MAERCQLIEKPMASPEFFAGKKLIQAIKRAGFEAGFVGGSVRDLLLGKRPADFDIVSTARPELLPTLFPDVKQVGASFGVALVESDGFSFEVATAREERNYLDGRHPELVRYTDSLAHDMQRRDFTINAMWLDPETMLVHDVVGGIDDLEQGVLRTVGDPRQRFAEDYLRMLRAIRFSARLRLMPDPAMMRSIAALAPQCACLAGERVAQELNRMLTGPEPARAMELLLDCGLLKVLLPEVAAMVGVEQPPEYHPEGDVWTHTLLMLRHMVLPDLPLAWSVLLHDIGKPPSRTVDPDGRARFFSHEVIGAELAEPLLERLHFSTVDKNAILGAIRNHMRFASVREMRPAKLRKLLADENFSLELELHRLDCISCHGMMEGFLFLLDQLAAAPEHRALPPPLVMGRDLVKAGMPPGPRFKAVLEAVFEAQLAGEITTREAALTMALEALR